METRSLQLTFGVLAFYVQISAGPFTAVSVFVPGRIYSAEWRVVVAWALGVVCGKLWLGSNR